MKIAVVGGGLAGLAAAWLLSQRHRVTLLERQSQPGFVASSVAVELGGQRVRVDVPLRVFYPGYYPTLSRLYQQLGVDTEPVSYSTSFTGPGGGLYFRWRNLRLGDRSVPYLLPHDLMSARSRRIAAAALRFGRRVGQAARRGELAGQTLGEFVERERLPAEFVDGMLLPVVATVATCTHDDARGYPAEVVAGYLGAGVAHESVRRARLGADDVASRLLGAVGRVKCDAGVTSVHADPAGARLHRRGQAEERFDHIVLATQANQALALWPQARPDEAATLRAFRYRALEVLMHRDEALMPRRRRDWSAVNAWVDGSAERPESTIWINAVQPALRSAPPLFQTVQPVREPRADRLLARARFERPLIDAASQQALAVLQRLHAEPGRRIWLCGSYAHPGVPLLESAVASAYAVAAAIEDAGRRAASNT